MIKKDARHCLECKHPLRGRSDKKFCDDSCRNSFNNRTRQCDPPLVKSINRCLQQNRRIIRKLLEQNSSGVISRQELMENGFSFRHHTHSTINLSGKPSYYCYEMGYQVLNDDCCLLLKNEGY